MSQIPILVHMQLHFLRDFLEHIEKGVAVEWASLGKRAENGEFEDYGDYERAMDYPLFRMDFGARAVYYELNALLESELQSLAAPIWHSRRPQATLKQSKLRTIHDLSVGEVVELLESKYGIERNNFPGWDAYEELRRRVNAFKHRRGMRRFEDMKNNPDTGGIEIRYKATFDEARNFLSDIKTLLDNLYALAESKKVDA